MHETSGRLRPVVEAYLRNEPLPAEKQAILRSYLASWIGSPAWDRNPVIDVIGIAHLGDLRRRVTELKIYDDLEQWLVEAEEYGFDPL